MLYAPPWRQRVDSSSPVSSIGLAGSLAAQPRSTTNLMKKDTFLRCLQSLTLLFRFESKGGGGFTYGILRLYL